MLFWIFIIALVVGIVCWVGGLHMFVHTCHDTEWFANTGMITTIVAALCIVISLVCITVEYVGVEGNVAANNQRYEMLTYQLENNLYDNDNDLGKKELYNQIQDWNEDLARFQALEKNFWIGIYYPNVFSQFEFIELPKGGQNGD